MNKMFQNILQYLKSNYKKLVIDLKVALFQNLHSSLAHH